MKTQFLAIYGLLMLISFPLMISAHGEVILTLEYEVSRSNDTTNTWYNSDFTESFGYTVQNQSSIIIEASSENDSSQGLHVSVGNLTLDDISDKEIEDNLAIGYWMVPDMFGFFANTSWDEVKTDFNSVSFNSSEFVMKELSYLGGEIEVYQISFKDNFQGTTLIYDAETGYLLEADSIVFGFTIHFIIFAINGDSLHFNAAGLSFNVFSLFLALPLIAIIIKKNKLT